MGNDLIFDTKSSQEFRQTRTIYLHPKRRFLGYDYGMMYRVSLFWDFPIPKKKVCFYGSWTLFDLCHAVGITANMKTSQPSKSELRRLIQSGGITGERWNGPYTDWAKPLDFEAGGIFYITKGKRLLEVILVSEPRFISLWWRFQERLLDALLKLGERKSWIDGTQ